MYERIERLKEKVVVDTYPICVEKYRITADTIEKNRNEPILIQRAKILEAVVERMPIFIQDDELIVGAGASKPMGLEIDSNYGIWSQEEIDSLKEDGFIIDPQDEADLQTLNNKYRQSTLIGKMGDIFYENERIISLLKSGFLLPPWRDKSEGKGVGGGYAQSGLGLEPSLVLLGVDYSRMINLGTRKMIQQAEEEIEKIRFNEKTSVERFRYLNAVIICLKAAERLAERYADLAMEMAQKENNRVRKKELEQIAESCRNALIKPAETFRDAIQTFWFTFLLLSPSTTLPGGRFDQLMYPFYKADLENGRITRDEAVELLCCLRLKDMELNRTSGKNNRKKNAGMAKWHNFVIGGVKPDGEDATNEISYLILEAAKITKTPHHTITLRVHENTPRELIAEALEVVKMGLGMPAFVGDESYIRTFTSRGVPIEDARDYLITGCLDANLPGKSRTGPVPMVIIPMIFDIFRHNGTDYKSGLRCGIETGEFTAFNSYDELFEAFKKQLDYCLNVVGEKNNVELLITQEILPDPLRSVLMDEGITIAKDAFSRRMLFENAAVINPIGIVNVGDSLAAIKKLVFDENKYTLTELNNALEADWEGYDKMRRDFLDAPKFGNNDDYADEIVAECYRVFAEITESIPTVLGGFHIPTGISITSHQPGGSMTLATPDGRKSGEILADGTMSPMRGMDKHGPLAVLSSAMKINQDPFQATLLNMKFHPSALRTKEDIDKLGSMIKTYLVRGGKHIQFNIVDKDTLIKAKAAPEDYRNLIVRVAGYSAYFVQLNESMQDEVIARVEHSLA